jgi:GTPase SAR1 family protein
VAINDRDDSVKTVMIADASVGKASIFSRLLKGTLRTDVATTLGVAFHTYARAVITEVPLAHSSYLTSRNDHHSISDIKSFAKSEVVIVLLGNKADSDAHRVVFSAEAEDFAKQHNIAYFDTSAKAGKNSEAAIK